MSRRFTFLLWIEENSYYISTMKEVVVQQCTIMQDLLEARLPIGVVLARQPKANRLRPHRQYYHLAPHRVFRWHRVRRWGYPRSLQ
jgi:hypothetical protein